ncbi:MAG: NUDIX hydrolase [Peptococcaceae bacterium]|nr:NUDIX hydrolase [Peptococcaceae bacterium]
MAKHELRNKDGLTEAEFLASYDAGMFERPSVTVDMLIFNVGEETDGKRDQKLLLIKRGNHPCLGQWALPGGFVDINESLDAAAQRELVEETGLSDVELEQMYTFGDVGRDPRTRTISTAYVAVIYGRPLQVQAGDDAAEAQWFNVSANFDAGFIKLELTASKVSLSAKLKVTSAKPLNCRGAKPVLVENNGIAFDHAKIILCGLASLQERLSIDAGD